VKEAVIPDAAKSPGEHVLKDMPQKILRLHGSVLRFTGVAVDVAEGHPALTAGDDVLLADDAAVEIARKVF
jgi:hypothetical protein